jgi:hypothetical protein
MHPETTREWNFSCNGEGRISVWISHVLKNPIVIFLYDLASDGNRRSLLARVEPEVRRCNNDPTA